MKPNTIRYAVSNGVHDLVTYSIPRSIRDLVDDFLADLKHKRFTNANVNVHHLVINLCHSPFLYILVHAAPRKFWPTLAQTAAQTAPRIDRHM